MKTTELIIGMLFLSFASIAQEKVIEIDAEITKVTIYNSSVEIHYSKEFLLPKGKSTIIFTGLTPDIVENTINISFSDKNLQIITVNERINFLKERQEKNKTVTNVEDSIFKIKNEIGLLDCKLEVLKIEKGLLFKDESIGGVSKGVSVTEIEKASSFFNKRYLELSTELFKIESKKKALNHNLKKFENQLDEISSNSSKSCSEIGVVVNNSTEKRLEVNFKFLSNGGGWAPLYDCKFEAADKPISFNFKANVFNSTGIPWENVEIKLSTASPTLGFEKPGFTKENPKMKNENVEFKDIPVINSIAEYSIKNSYSIPSDAKPYIIEVESFKMKSEFYYLLIPSMDQHGFLMVKIPDWNKYNLIPGTTNIFNTDSYMGKTFLNTYAENDTLTIFLGKDNSVTCTRKDDVSFEKNKIIGNNEIDQSLISISVKNNCAENLKITIWDQIPVFKENEKVKFNIYNIDNATMDKKEGLLIWNYSINSGENININYKYEIRYPKEDGYNYNGTRYRKFRTISCPSF
jgi:hypothetical protein